MKRFLSVWLPRWPIERRHGYIALQGRSGPPSHSDAPFVLSTSSQSGACITATNAAADRIGLYVGMPLTDARAICPSLMVDAADPEGDSAALRQLALWCRCYSPLTRPDDPDGLAIDITGCAHLFGGEAVLLKKLENRLHGFGLTAALVTAPTIGAAWAAARHAAGKRIIITIETLHKHLAPLPTAALRLEEPAAAALAKIGLKRIGDLRGKRCARLAARFGPQLAERLDQAFGKQDESFCGLTPPPFYRAERRFAEPIDTMPAIESATRLLAHDLAETLNKAGKGARKLELALFRVDGWSETLGVQTSALALSRDANHLARLLCERLDRIKDHTGFGFEAAMLSAFDVEDVTPHQEIFLSGGEQREKADDLARLLDRFVNRFGVRNVTRFVTHASYIPERAARSVPVLRNSARHGWAAHVRALQGDTCLGRPFLLLASPEPVTALSEVPDGPPVRFEWRRISHRVTRADGPERIAHEWWHEGGGENRQTRDYYRVEDDAGRRFWLYRDGLHERQGDTPRWFIHGVFA
ncbi:MAG: DNA polymerase Y family protein [Alphaproteobacteria bacterium]|nr:DNA polymerase Y family protein [Alphaproteobacteria bacterium]